MLEFILVIIAQILCFYLGRREGIESAMKIGLDATTDLLVSVRKALPPESQRIMDATLDAQLVHVKSRLSYPRS